MTKSLVAGLVAVFASFGTGSAAFADTITPYADPGLVNTGTYDFRAAATGDVTGFFAGASAADASVVGLSVNGGAPVVFGLNNQTTAVSQSLDFGSVNAGDQLTFILRNLTSGTQFSSNPTSNPDGLQHIFSTSSTSSNGAIPSGTQISFEDLSKSQGSDFDYNDASFVFTNIADPVGGLAAINPAPIPAALSLFAGGLGVLGSVGGVAFFRRRKASRSRR